MSTRSTAPSASAAPVEPSAAVSEQEASDDPEAFDTGRLVSVAWLLRTAPLDVLLGVAGVLLALRFLFADRINAGGGSLCPLCGRALGEHPRLGAPGTAVACPFSHADTLLTAVEVVTPDGRNELVLWRRLALARATMLDAASRGAGAGSAALDEIHAVSETLRCLGIDPATGAPLTASGALAAATGGAT